MASDLHDVPASALDDMARALLGEWNRRGILAVVMYSDGECIPVLCQRESDVEPLLKRVLAELNKPRTLN